MVKLPINNIEGLEEEHKKASYVLWPTVCQVYGIHGDAENNVARLSAAASFLASMVADLIDKVKDPQDQAMLEEELVKRLLKRNI